MNGIEKTILLLNNSPSKPIVHKLIIDTFTQRLGCFIANKYSDIFCILFGAKSAALLI